MRTWDKTCLAVAPSSWPVCAYCGASPMLSGTRQWTTEPQDEHSVPPYPQAHVFMMEQCMSGSSAWHVCRWVFMLESPCTCPLSNVYDSVLKQQYSRAWGLCTSKHASTVVSVVFMQPLQVAGRQSATTAVGGAC